MPKKSVISNTSRPDWSRIDAMTDNEIDTSDILPLTDEFFSKAKLRMPFSSLATAAIRVDSETLAWFQSKGEEAEHLTEERYCASFQCYLLLLNRTVTKRDRPSATPTKLIPTPHPLDIAASIPSPALHDMSFLSRARKQLVKIRFLRRKLSKRRIVLDE
ncbi:hypothetical protein NIES4075_41070 [Tolypothrix sp. NIES-4075]|nr:hypothetical protein NIES4075_41070 [Tolypothrix sp. NIES-4075]